MQQKVRTMKPEKVIIPIIIALAIIFAAVYFVKTPFERYTSISESKKTKMKENQALQSQIRELQEQKAQEQANLDTLRPFMEMTGDFSSDSLASFGGMLDDIVENYIKPQRIMVRSIDYTIDPPEDPISSAFKPNYHSCELELYLICKYPQLHDFIYNIINNFPNFISISQMVVTAYPADKEYLLVDLKLNLYVKRAGA